MDNQFDSLAKGEVLSVDESSQILIGHRTFRVGEFADAIRTQLEYGLGGWTEEKDGWFSDQGIPCEVLKFGSNGWQKGKVRFSLEFCPEDPQTQQSSTIEDSEPQRATIPATLDEEVLVGAEAPLIYEEELILIEVPESALEELEMAPESAFGADELDLTGESAFGADDLEIAPEAAFGVDELDLTGESAFGADELDLTGESAFGADDLEIAPEAAFGADELDLTGESAFGADELDLTGESGFSADELDLTGESAFGANDLEFPELSEKEENPSDSLLDDVWQDMNEASWRNNQ
ncbi:KGK domain-containing protein [Trichocoleus sp. DQ-U1]|uniref:KGK domain-containing protein n=1 Tax=Trichocoleus sp. DQ-U1 TaxID=2933926 RepID=UPI003299C892